MSAAAELPARRPRTAATLVALYRLVLRTQVTVPRLFGIGALGALSILLGVFAGLDDRPAQASADVTAHYGLGLVVPLAALWLGTAAIGDLVEDRLLVYLWLKPVARWQLPAAAVLATVTLVIPLAAAPLAVAALVAGAGDVALVSFAAASLAACAYAGLFVAAGLWFRRAVWWGLAFILLWENAGSHASDGTQRFTVTSWARSVVASAPDVHVSHAGRSATAAFFVLPAIGVVGWAVATIRYRRADID